MRNVDPRLILAAGLMGVLGGVIGLVGAVANDRAPVWEILISVGLVLLGLSYLLRWWARRTDGGKGADG